MGKAAPRIKDGREDRQEAGGHRERQVFGKDRSHDGRNPHDERGLKDEQFDREQGHECQEQLEDHEDQHPGALSLEQGSDKVAACADPGEQHGEHHREAVHRRPNEEYQDAEPDHLEGQGRET